MSRFSIVEFEDGLQLVPSNWLRGTSECFWPTHENNIKRLHKNIAECKEPDDENWEIVKVVRIFGTANTYESGMTKVKLAEKFSDIDSDVDNTSKKSRRLTTLTKSTYSDEDDSSDDWQNKLPPPPKKPVSKTLSIINSKNNKPMDDSLPLKNGATRKNSNDNTLQSVQDISKKRPTEASVSTVEDIELKKELLRRWNKIDKKLECIDERLKSLEERLENGIGNKCKNYFDITEIVSFPLKTKEALDKLDLDLQDADFYKNMINFMKHLGGKTYHEMTTIILKHTISNFLSALYCWNGKDGKKEAFKDLLIAKCIKQCVNSKFETATDQQIVQIISKWFLQGKLRHDRDEERLQRKQQK